MGQNARPVEAGSLRFERNGELVTRRVAGQTLVVPVRRQVGDLESIFTLNEVGTLLWGRVDGRTTVEEMVQEVCGAFAVEEAEARADTLEFLRSLEEADLIRRSGEEEAHV